MNSELLWAFVRMLVALPLVLGLAYLVLKYGLSRRYMTTSGSRRLKMVEQLSLGPKTTLSLISLGERHYLLAHQESSVSLIKELDKLPELEELKAGDIVELTPRTIGDFDRLQSTVASRKPGSLQGVFGQTFSSPFNKLSATAARAKGILKSRMASETRTGEKGENKR